MQAARLSMPPAWTRDIQLDASNTHWLQSLPAASQAFTATWLLQHLTAAQGSLQSSTHHEPYPLPTSTHCSLPTADGSDPTQSGSSGGIDDFSMGQASGLSPGQDGCAPAASGYPLGAAVGSAAASGLQPATSGLAPAVSGLQPAERGSSDGSTGNGGRPETAQEWQTWHEDMEEWSESCCPAAEAVVSTAHAIAQSMPDPDTGNEPPPPPPPPPPPAPGRGPEFLQVVCMDSTK